MKHIRQVFETLKQDVSFFPSELSGQPLITIKGNRQFIIENAYLLTSFTSNKIRMATADQTIEIIGKDIKLKAMYKDELIVEGTLESIQFIDEKEDL